MTSEAILHLMKNLGFHNVSIYRNFDQNWFINEYAKKFFLRNKRTHILMKKNLLSSSINTR